MFCEKVYIGWQVRVTLGSLYNLAPMFSNEILIIFLECSVSKSMWAGRSEILWGAYLIWFYCFILEVSQLFWNVLRIGLFGLAGQSYTG
jgi:hypothetical protein